MQYLLNLIFKNNILQ